jgi:hypothetical protein
MPQALRFLVLTFAGWLNRHQEDLIDYLSRLLRWVRSVLLGFIARIPICRPAAAEVKGARG